MNTTMTIAAEAAVAAAKGARFMDAKTPGRFTLIKLSKLRISSAQHCILGQCFGSFRNGMHNLGLDNETTSVLGMQLPQDIDAYKYIDLDHAWREEIEQRRASA